jgi:hypothetical protein
VEPARKTEPIFTLRINNIHLWFLYWLPITSQGVFVLQARVFGIAISQRPFEPHEDQSEEQVAKTAEKDTAG